MCVWSHKTGVSLQYQFESWTRWFPDWFRDGRGLLGSLLLLASASSTAICAQPAFVQLGKHQVHPTRILARYAASTGPQARTTTLASAGLTIRRQYELVPGLLVLDSSGEDHARTAKLRPMNSADAAAALQRRIRLLEDSGLFEYVQASYVYTNALVPTDARFGDSTLWGLRNSGASGGVLGADIGAVKAWDITTGSTNVIVAIIDSGIRYTHQELATQMWRNPGETPGNGIDDDHDGYIDDVFGINAAAGNGNPFDDNDHGSHVAGTIGAAANDGHPHVGVSWNVQLMACKFLGADGFGTSEDAIACIDFAVRHGARIINASWGGGPFERALLDSLTEARHQGVLFVAAAGNDFSDNDSDAFYPASYRLDNIISVAALDRRDRLPLFSNYGQASVHIGAPGQSIFSCTAQSDSAYDTFDGTSMAAPHVTGVAALILARFPNASVPEIRERLLSTAVSIPNLVSKVSTGGRVNAYRALSATPDGTLETGFDPPEGSDLSARRPVRFTVTVTDLIGVTNATVQAKVQDSASVIVFHNDGTGGDEKAGDEVYTADLTLPTTPGPFNIVFEIKAAGKTDATRAATYNIAAPPLNDNLADALDIPSEGALLQWTNRFATIETGEPKHAKSPTASASVWWNWRPGRSGPVIVDTAGSSFDTVLGVYTNSTYPTLKEVASADDAPNRKQGYVIFEAAAGVVYHLAVAGYTAADIGTVRLRVQPGGGPDSESPQVTITGPATGLVVTNATDAKVVVTGTALDPGTNVSGVKQVQVQVNRGVATTAMGTTNWSSTVLLREGSNRIKVNATDYSGNASLVRSVTVSYQPLISPNDFFADAFELKGEGGAVSGDNSRATKEPGESAHAGGTGGKSIWWFYRPTTDGVLTVSTANSAFNTLLAVYLGTSSGGVRGLQDVASNDDASPGSSFSSVSQAVRAGATYYIAVDGVGGASGEVQLEYSFRPASVLNVVIESTAGGSVAPGSGAYEKGASATFLATPDAFFLFEGWDGTVRSTENPLTLVIESDIRLIPRFKAAQFTDDFETGAFAHLAWTSSGNVPWTVQGAVVEAGKFAARSGLIGNGEKSGLLLKAVCRAGSGSFGVRVSSEATWDTLDFYMNGKRLNRWSGEVAWTTFTFPVPAGTNSLEWRYSKDFFNTTAGLDAAFIDNLGLPLALPPDASTPAHLSIERLGEGSVQLIVAGQPGQVYVIQRCSQLTAWAPVFTNSADRAIILWQTQSSEPQQFFRAIVP